MAKVSLRLLQLYALRTQLDAIIYQAEQDEGHIPAEAVDLSGCPHCQAPEDKQAEASTMAGPRMRLCLSCGKQYEPSYPALDSPRH